MFSEFPQFTADVFPAWTSLNNAQFKFAKLQDVEGKGLGLLAEKDMKHDADDDATNSSMLLKIPYDIVLSSQTVEEYSKVDQNFRQLLEVAGHKSTRHDILLYLLTHLLLPAQERGHSTRVVATPWTEYIKFLPRPIPVPTMWSEAERELLINTSLARPLSAKVAALAQEFDELREESSEIPFWNTYFWQNGTATLHHWTLVDAWYRSRSLELPRSGDAMVPGLDMVNHSHQPTAYYEEDNLNNVVLLLRPSSKVACGEELTISYGEAKSAAEMLFSYGFIDKNDVTPELTLVVDTDLDDPLAKAKKLVSTAPASVTMVRTEGKVTWKCPFVYLSCLNEEDGLEFRVLQDTAGERQLRLFWQDEDVTEQTDRFETLIQDHPLCQIFKLRVVTILHELVSRFLNSSESPHEETSPSVDADEVARSEYVEVAGLLKEFEHELASDALKVLQEDMTHLMADDHVVAYLGAMEEA